MPLPADVTTITLTGCYEDLTGNPQAGTVTFTPNASPFTDAVAKVIFEFTTFTATLDAGGSFSITLPCTDNPNFAPSGWVWQVVERINGAQLRSYSIALPHSLGGTVDISTLAQVPSTMPVQAYLPLPGGVPAAGQVPVSTGSGDASAWAALFGWLDVVRAFGAKGDVRDLTAVAIGSGLTVLTCAGGAFTAADVGKVCYAYGAGVAGAPLVTTIASINSPTSVNLTAAASSTVASGNAFVGTDDAAAWQAALNAVPANGGTIFLGQGYASYAGTALSVKVSGTIVQGGGFGAQIRYDGSIASPLFSAASASTKFFTRDIRLSQVNPASSGTCIDMSNMARSWLERLTVDAGGAAGKPPLIGLDLNGANAHYNRMTECYVGYGGAGGVGIRIQGTAHKNTVAGGKVSPDSTADSASSGIYITNAHSTTLYDVDVELANGNGIFLDTAAHGTTIINPYLEGSNINLKISSGVIAPTVIGGTIESGVTANIQDNGSVGSVILNGWPDSGTSSYNHLELVSVDAFQVNGVQVPANTRQPGDVGLMAWNFDPLVAEASSAAVNGTIYLLGIVLREQTTITNLAVYLSGGATTPTANENYLALVDSGGTVRGQTAAGAIDSATASSGWLSHAMTAPYMAPAGRYWVAVLLNAATPPTLARATGSSLAGVEAGGTTAASYWVAVNGTGATALPGSFTPSSNSHTGAITACVAVS